MIKTESETDMYLRSSFFWDVTQRGLVVTDVSGQCVGIILKSEVVKDDLFACLILEDGMGRLFRKVGNYQSKLCNIPEELKMSFTLWQRPKITQSDNFLAGIVYTCSPHLLSDGFIR